MYAIYRGSLTWTRTEYDFCNDVLDTSETCPTGCKEPYFVRGRFIYFNHSILGECYKRNEYASTAQAKEYFVKFVMDDKDAAGDSIYFFHNKKDVLSYLYENLEDNKEDEDSLDYYLDLLGQFLEEM